MICKVTRFDHPPQIDARWDKAPWTNVEPHLLGNHMGDKPTHFPMTQFKIAYDEQAVYVIFRVEDRYVRAVAQNYQGPVCRDSCVEFFFTPSDDLSEGYFNLEVNCGGTALLYYQHILGKDTVKLPEAEFQEIAIAHSMPKIVEPEVAEPTIWTIEYRLPVEVLKKYCRAVSPAPGAVWRANFYKCADQTSHPHWLTWSPVDWPTPKFHIPACFGELHFQ
jgi:hypothetical protein